MDQTTHEVRLANWTRIIEQCQNRPLGQTAKQWLAENNISDKTYYYWLRRVRIKTLETKVSALPPMEEKPALPMVSFAEIPAKELIQPEPSAAIVIKTQKSTIEISSSVSETLIVELIKAVKHAL